MTGSGCVFGTGPAAGSGVEAVKDGHGVVVAIGEVFELASEAVGDAEFDAEPVNIADTEAVHKAGAEVEAELEPKSVAELDLVASGYATYYKLSSEVVVAWNSEVSFGVVFEPRVGFASEAEERMAPCENTWGAQLEVLAGAQLGATVVEPEVLDKPETVELDIFAEGMVGELDASAGQWLGFVALV